METMSNENIAKSEGQEEIDLLDRIVGRVVWAGNLTVNDEEMTGVAVEISPEKLGGKPLPMYQEVAIIPVAELDGWTVKYEDWKRLAYAAQWLACACRDRLPPGHFAKLDEEYNAVREIFRPAASKERHLPQANAGHHLQPESEAKGC